MIFGKQPIAPLPGVSAAHDAGNAVDDEEDADRNGPDRKDRRAYQAIPQVGQVRFGLPGTRAKYKKISPTVAVESRAKATKANTTTRNAEW